MLAIRVDAVDDFDRRHLYMHILSYDEASGSEITPCNKIDKPLVVYRFTENVMTSITTLLHNGNIITFLHRQQ